MASPAPATAQPSPISVPAAIDPGKGTLNLNIFNGARQPFSSAPPVLLTIIDGQQNQLYRQDIPQPSISLILSIHNNLADNYSVIAWANGYWQAGFQPVKM